MVLFFVFLLVQNVSAQRAVPPDREGLLRGEGMGMATAAEVSGFPGPRHVLELKDQLGLTPEQLLKTNALYESVKASAVVQGEEIVKAEEELLGLFAKGPVVEGQLEQRLLQIAKQRAMLRFAHLQAHLRMSQILTPAQIARYIELRNHAGHH